MTGQKKLVVPKLKGTPLTDPKLSVTVTDKSGAVCGEAEQKVTVGKELPTWPEQTVTVAINKDCPDAQVTAVVKNGDTVLAGKNTAGLASVATKPTSKNNFSRYLVALLVVLVLLAGLGVTWWYWKKKKSSNHATCYWNFLVCVCNQWFTSIGSTT
jgi:hypothetical protein